MKMNFHGVFSLFLAASAIVFSGIVLLSNSLKIGIAFFFLCAIFGFLILRLFCAQCPGRENCGHFFPGLVVKRIFPNIQPGPFTPVQLSMLSAMILLIIGIPQYWLMHNINGFIIYWAVMIIAGVEIKSAVCPTCCNTFCPSNPAFMRRFCATTSSGKHTSTPK